MKHKIEKYQFVLLTYTILSFGAMVLSPHYPDRATFGTMVVGIVLLLTVIGDMLGSDADNSGRAVPGRLQPYFVNWLILFFWLYTVFKLLAEFVIY